MEQEYYAKSEVQQLLHQNFIDSFNSSVGYISLLFTIVSVIGIIGGYFFQKWINTRLKEVKDIEDRTICIQNFIENKSHEFYHRMKEEEISYILDSLIKAPVNISNMSSFLFSFSIRGEKNLEKLKKIFNLNSIQPNHQRDILLLLISNYPQETFIDDILWNSITENNYKTPRNWSFSEHESRYVSEKINDFYNNTSEQQKYESKFLEFEEFMKIINIYEQVNGNTPKTT